MPNHPAIVAVAEQSSGNIMAKNPEKLIEEAWLAASKEFRIGTKKIFKPATCRLLFSNNEQAGLEEGFPFRTYGTSCTNPRSHSLSQRRPIEPACHAIRSGAYSTVLVGGIEKMTIAGTRFRDDLMLFGRSLELLWQEAP